MNDQQASVLWLSHRDELVKLRTLSRNLEMICDATINGMEMIQFCDDVEMYNIYEAVLMLDEKLREKVMHSVLVEMKLSSLPRMDLNIVNYTGKLKKKPFVGLRPESTWTLQKHLIVDQKFDRMAEQIFERALPPHISHKYISMCKERNVWEGVREAPIEFREALCQRLLVHYDIPDVPAAKNMSKHIVEGQKKKAKDKVLIIDKAGNAWTWNCGWYRIGEDGKALDNKPPMGHAAHMRCIIPAGPEDYARSSFRYTRPWGQWRKGSGPVAHKLFGNGMLILTDGMHAVVLFADGVKREVVLENLQSIAERSVSRATAPTKKPRTAPTKKELSLEELLKML